LFSNLLVEMNNSDIMLSNAQGYCLCLGGYQPFVVYLPAGGNACLGLSTLTTADTLRVWWYNPRSGGSLRKGALLIGGGSVYLGNPPADVTSDWVALVIDDYMGSPEDGVGVRAAKTNSRSGARGVRSITTHGGIVRLALPSAAKYDLVEIIASSGRVVAACRPNSIGKIDVRLRARGIYLVSAKTASSRAVIARVLCL